MPTTFANTISLDGGVTNLPIYADRAEKDAAGSDIQQTYATKSEVTTGLSGKQDTISDLATIRSGAQAGASAVQPGDLATVATTGDYDDLSNKPDLSVYAESADLATVATTGDYSDLTGTPSIPTATSDLTNDSGFITLSDVPAQVNADWNSSSGVSEILNKPDLSVYAETADLATVATTGSYTDLSNKPTIPSGTQLVPAATAADADKVLTVDSQGVPGWAVIPQQPTGLFQATYGTSTYNEVRDAVAANKIVYCYVNGRMAFLAYVSPNFYEFQYYRSNSSSLGTDSVFVYQVKSTGWETEERTVKAGNIRYPVTQVNVNGSSAMTGTVANITIPAAPTVDQTYDSTSTNAQSGTAVAGAISTKQDTISDLATIRSGAQLGATAVQPGDLAAVATTGDYTDLYNTPSIPTATSDLTNDSGFITLSDVPAQVQPDWDATSGLGEILHKPDLSIYAESADLATVATTGSYDDLLDKPVIPAAQVNSDWNASSGAAEILNKPQLSTVATTGDYDDLVNKPSIPAAQVNSDWNAVSGVSEILNKPTLATVATSGSYNDLSNKPDLSVYAESADLATVATTGAYSDLTGTPTIPTATSDLTNDSGFITSADLPTIDQTYNATSTNAQSGTAVAGAVATKQDVISDLATIRSGAQAGSTAVQPGDLATVATTGAYSDLTGTPTIPTATSDLTNDSGFITLSDVPAQVNADWNSSSGASEILHKPDLSIYAQSSSLATVATTGDYDDLVNKPTIPAAQVNADWNAASGVAQILNKPTIPAALTAGNGIDITSNVVSAKVDGVSVSINASGELQAATGGVVDQNYNAASTNAQSGTAVAQAIATKEDAFTVGTGLEMDTTGGVNTLQVEAPVDIVAGTGIAIDNPDGNTMRVTNIGYPISETDAVLCGTFKGDPMYMKTYTFTGTVGTSETTIAMSIDEKKGTDGVNRIWIDPSNSFVVYGSAGNNFLPISWRLASGRQGSVGVLGATTGSLSCRCVDTSSTPLTFNITIRYTVIP